MQCWYWDILAYISPWWNKPVCYPTRSLCNQLPQFGSKFFFMPLWCFLLLSFWGEAMWPFSTKSSLTLTPHGGRLRSKVRDQESEWREVISRMPVTLWQGRWWSLWGMRNEEIKPNQTKTTVIQDNDTKIISLFTLLVSKLRTISSLWHAVLGLRNWHVLCVNTFCRCSEKDIPK